MRYTAGISASSSKLKFTLGIRCRPACTAGQGNGMTGLWRRLLIPALVAGAWIHAGAPAYASESLHLGTVPAAVAGGQPFQLTATGTTNNGQAHLAIFGQPAGKLTEVYRSQAGNTCRTPSVRFSASAR